ncbi:hypothetical protein HHI36_009997 [Cryptolaemus montrouzieri]|uniref:Uncharacterized protein n=1 Tax=Cryptolaemus montrouzieri TaxID=559131 RepID=A0ABD2MHH7_9CUCU
MRKNSHQGLCNQRCISTHNGISKQRHSRIPFEGRTASEISMAFLSLDHWSRELVNRTEAQRHRGTLHSIDVKCKKFDCGFTAFWRIPTILPLG